MLDKPGDAVQSKHIGIFSMGVGMGPVGGVSFKLGLCRKSCFVYEHDESAKMASTTRVPGCSIVNKRNC